MRRVFHIQTRCHYDALVWMCRTTRCTGIQLYLFAMHQFQQNCIPLIVSVFLNADASGKVLTPGKDDNGSLQLPLLIVVLPILQ
jgi:hypothetical protein